MKLNCEKRFLDFDDIQGRWTILNPLLEFLNTQPVLFKIWTDPLAIRPRKAVFYLHGLGGTLDDCPFIEDTICSNAPLVRVSCWGATDPERSITWASFGDVCAMLHNARQSIYTLADIMDLESYSIVAHSWGGFIACIAALNDNRCAKAMLLASTPDICDALSQMSELFAWPDGVSPLLHVFTGELSQQAELAKHGASQYQEAWDKLSPYGPVANERVDMLIFNRSEDPVMRRDNVEHFIEYCRTRGISGIRAEFNEYPELADRHDMPPEKFEARMGDFLFRE
jgi:pimeloyl-ACP methyl ester carboxylesterase